MIYDVAVVGGSFAGLAAAIQIARARRSVVVIDAGSPRNRFADASHGFLGHDGRSPEEIHQLGRANLMVYPSAFVRADLVTQAEKSQDGFVLTLDQGDTVTARRVILAIGVKDTLPSIEGFDACWGLSVIHCPYCHGYEVAGRRLGIFHAGKASLHQAHLIPDWSDDVTFFTNGVALLTEERETILARGVKLEETPIIRLRHEARQIHAVVLEDGRNIPLDAMFTSTRTAPASDLAAQLGCRMVEGPFGPYIEVDNLQETSVSGIFAAGDAARPVHNATWAASDGVSAGIFAHQSLISERHPYHRKTR